MRHWVARKKPKATSDASALNQRIQGSSPCAPTIEVKEIGKFARHRRLAKKGGPGVLYLRAESDRLVGGWSLRGGKRVRTN